MDAVESNVFDLIVKSDGVYLSIVYPDGSPKVQRSDVIAMVDAYGVVDVDYIALSEAVKSNEKQIEVKISHNTKIIQVDESASLEVSPDRMEAYIIFSPPVNKGKIMTHDDIVALLDKDKIAVKDHGLISAAITNKRYERKVLIAQGKAPIAGADGFLQFRFDKSNLKPKPKIMEDGTVNFKQLGMFKICNRGDVLVTSVPAREGKNGMDVFGQDVIPLKPRPAAPIPRGKGTVLSLDGLHLIADVSGQLILQDGKINISPHLEIGGDVDNSTGDIEFNGQVTVRGNVLSGFTVKAVGNVEIFGVCEAANIISEEGSIVLGNGAQGSGKGFLKAAKDVTAKFLEGCDVTAGGNVTADSIMKSKVQCDGSINASGKNGFLVGGSLVAGDKVTARTIGSPMGTATDIEVGGNPKALQRHKELFEELSKIKTEYEKSEKAIGVLTGLKDRNQLTDDKKTLLVKMINLKMVYRDKMTKMQTEIDTLARTLAVSSGTVSASKVIRPGVRVTIGDSQMVVRDEISNCKLRSSGGKITIGPNI